MRSKQIGQFHDRAQRKGTTTEVTPTTHRAQRTSGMRINRKNRNPGPGWKPLGTAGAWKHTSGILAFSSGYCVINSSKYTGENRSRPAKYEFVNANGGNRDRGVMAWAMDLAKRKHPRTCGKCNGYVMSTRLEWTGECNECRDGVDGLHTSIALILIHLTRACATMASVSTDRSHHGIGDGCIVHRRRPPVYSHSLKYHGKGPDDQ